MGKLVRSTSNKMVGGVCAGIADAYGYVPDQFCTSSPG